LTTTCSCRRALHASGFTALALAFRALLFIINRHLPLKRNTVRRGFGSQTITCTPPRSPSYTRTPRSLARNIALCVTRHRPPALFYPSPPACLFSCLPRSLFSACSLISNALTRAAHSYLNGYHNLLLTPRAWRTARGQTRAVWLRQHWVPPRRFTRHLLPHYGRVVAFATHYHLQHALPAHFAVTDPSL